MRIREFRGKDPVNGKWRLGDYIHYTGGDIGIREREGEGERTIVSDGKVIPETVGQFTGAIDCEINKIYEYDFVVFVEGGKIPKIVLRSRNSPEFRLYSCALEGFNVGYSYELKFYDSREAYKVVGNIFDNPELIQNEVYERLMEMIKNDDT